MDRAGVVGADGATHNGVFDIAYLRTLPGIVLLAPAFLDEMVEMMRFGLASAGPVAIRYPRGSAAPPLRLGRPSTPVELGKAEMLRDGPDGAILAYGSLVAPALEAARGLAKRGIDVAVVNARFAKPLDTEMIDTLAATRPFLVTAEEHMVAGGFGSAVLEHLSGRGIPARVKVLGIPDEYQEHAGRGEILRRLGLDVDGIAGAVEEMVHAEAPGPWQ
jgi:1-deoxy-D-xylulose-5-phosphate synthase